MQNGPVRTEERLENDADGTHRILANEKSAFKLLMGRYNRPHYHTARSILRDDAEAKDVLQDPHIVAYCNLRTFRGESTTKTWLSRIALSYALYRSRRRRVARKLFQSALSQTGTNVGKANFDSNSIESLEQATERKEMRRLVEPKIDELPELSRAVFMLQGLEVTSIEESAACIGIPRPRPVRDIPP